MITTTTFKRGINKGVTTLWELVKIVVPVYVFITFLKYTPVLEWVARVSEPAMKIFGLPGEASIVLVLGKLINIYAALGAITSLQLAPREVTIIAVMLLLSHSLLVESAISQKAGAPGLFMGSIRVMLSIIAGILMNLII